MPTLTHPKLPGREIECTEDQASVHEKSGWERKSDKAPKATAPPKAPANGPTNPTSPSVGEEN